MLDCVVIVDRAGASGGSFSGKMTEELRPVFAGRRYAEAAKTERHLARGSALQPAPQAHGEAKMVNRR